MAFRYIFVLSVLVVLAQGSYVDIVEHESLEGAFHSGGVSAAASLAGVPHGRSAVAQPQRPALTHGLAGPAISGSRTHVAVGGALNRPGAGSPNRHVGGSLNRHTGASYNRRTGGNSVRLNGAGHGNAHPNLDRSQKPH
ncbi:uncharacterized protein [Drosophila bipectinata]|uniref:uncharacterized protein n=1 Tax=Drosophila bipectinata TaxID=42026 RepID=UPI001C898490|nr:uncharacterized protein LOC108130943 [Drosophila bipectinata]